MELEKASEISDLARDIPKEDFESFSLFDLIDSVSECSSKAELDWSQCQESW